MNTYKSFSRCLLILYTCNLLNYLVCTSTVDLTLMLAHLPLGLDGSSCDTCHDKCVCFFPIWKTRLVSHLPPSVSSTLISRLMLNIRDPKNSGLVVASTSYSTGTFDQTRVISFLPVSRRSSVTVWHAKHDAMCLDPCNRISTWAQCDLLVIYSVNMNMHTKAGWLKVTYTLG